jgi:hypothetical protein
MPGCSFDAEGASHLDALAHGNTERRVQWPAASNQYGRIVKGISDRQHWQLTTVGGEKFNAAEDGGVERPNAHGRLEARE